jgi:hypothetical protein
MAQQYKIRLKGQLSPAWASYFEGFKAENEENGETILTGEVTDQAALHGLLSLIRDLGIPLLEVRQIQSDAAQLHKASC